MSELDYRSEIDMWQDLWSAAEESGIHPPLPPMKPSNIEGGDTPQDCYYDYLDTEEAYDELLQEQKTPNPVYPDSVGPDFATTPPVWASEAIVKEVESLKNKLFDVENKLAEKMGGGKKWQEKAYQPDNSKLVNEIESLRKRIEKVSSTLGVENELARYDTSAVKKD